MCVDFSLMHGLIKDMIIWHCNMTCVRSEDVHCFINNKDDRLKMPTVESLKESHFPFLCAFYLLITSLFVLTFQATCNFNITREHTLDNLLYVGQHCMMLP